MGNRPAGNNGAAASAGYAPVSGPPVSHLRFDVFAEAAKDGGQ